MVRRVFDAGVAVFAIKNAAKNFAREHHQGWWLPVVELPVLTDVLRIFGVVAGEAEALQHAGVGLNRLA